MDLERRLERGPLRVVPLWSAERTDQLPQQVLRKRRRRALTRAVAGTAAALAVAAGVWIFSLRGAGVAPSAQTLRELAPSGAREFALADGSQVSLLAAGSRVDVVEQTPALVRTRLGKGGARFDVRHDERRLFEVESGDVKVRVLGTAFSLVQTGDVTRVAVERGAVLVRWTGGEVVLSAGQAGDYPPRAAVSAGAQAPPSSPPAHEQTPSPLEAAGNWRGLAKRGAYADAYQALGPGLGKSVHDDPTDLMLAADVARLSRHPTEATRFLSRVADGFPRDRRAPLAAFTLGRVLLEDLGQPARAADAFRRAQQLAPRGPLASDALAREVEAAQRAGQAERAKQVARRYLELYPEGPQAERLRKL